MSMNKKCLTKLEYNKIIDQLVANASSQRGKLLCRNLVPLTDLAQIETSQEQTAAAFTRIVKKGRVNFSDVFPMEESMKRLEVGAILSTTELLRVGRVIRTAAHVKSYGSHDTVDDLADCLDASLLRMLPLSVASFYAGIWFR